MSTDSRWIKAAIALMDADPVGMRDRLCKRITTREALIRYYECLQVHYPLTYVLAAQDRLASQYEYLADDQAMLAALDAQHLAL